MKSWVFIDDNGAPKVYWGFTITGAAYAFSPRGARAEVARQMRKNISERAVRLKSYRERPPAFLSYP